MYTRPQRPTRTLIQSASMPARPRACSSMPGGRRMGEGKAELPQRQHASQVRLKSRSLSSMLDFDANKRCSVLRQLYSAITLHLCMHAASPMPLTAEEGLVHMISAEVV